MNCADGTIITDLERRIGKLPDQATLHYNGTWYVKVSALKGVTRPQKSYWLPEYHEPVGGIALTRFTCINCGYKTFSGRMKYCPGCGYGTWRGIDYERS